MVRFGYKLMSEEHGPRALVRNARLAEDAGFDFVAISDHFHPWLESQHHAPFAWSVLGAVAEGTKRVGIATGVTCPIMRYHPAIVAQAAATIGVMSEGRFTLALGSGERLNEHVVSAYWPEIEIRHEMLAEAVAIIRKLWEGENCSYHGAYFELENARLYDLPDEDIPLIIAAAGEKAAALAAEHGDGLMATEADGELIKSWKKAGGIGPVYGETGFAYAPSKAEGLKLAHTYHRFSAVGWTAMTELPTVKSFEDATKFVREEDVKSHIPHGPDVEDFVKEIRSFIDAGFDHIALTAIGPDQERFIRFFERELGPRLRGLKTHKAA